MRNTRKFFMNSKAYLILLLALLPATFCASKKEFPEPLKYFIPFIVMEGGIYYLCNIEKIAQNQDQNSASKLSLGFALTIVNIFIAPTVKNLLFGHSSNNNIVELQTKATDTRDNSKILTDRLNKIKI